MGGLGLMLSSPGLLEEQVLTCCLDMEMEEPFHTYMGYTLEKKYQSLHANLLCNVIHSPQAGREVPMVVILNGLFPVLSFSQVDCISTTYGKLSVIASSLPASYIASYFSHGYVPLCGSPEWQHQSPYSLSLLPKK